MSSIFKHQANNYCKGSKIFCWSFYKEHFFSCAFSVEDLIKKFNKNKIKAKIRNWTTRSLASVKLQLPSLISQKICRNKERLRNKINYNFIQNSFAHGIKGKYHTLLIYKLKFIIMRHEPNFSIPDPFPNTKQIIIVKVARSLVASVQSNIFSHKHPALVTSH